MIKTTPKNLLKFFGAIAIVALLYVFVYWPISPLGHNLHNLKLAEDHAKILQAKFRNDPTFQKIKFTQFYTYGAGLTVVGDVQAEEDIRYVTNAIESMPSPVEIHYSLSASNGLVEFSWYDRHSQEPQWTR
jgi:hypothetical protein